MPDCKCLRVKTKNFINTANKYMHQINYANSRKGCKLCSKLKIKNPERRRFDIFIVNFGHISLLCL